MPDGQASPTNPEIRNAILSLAPGQHIDFKPPPAEPLRRYLQRVCGQAHKALGPGHYRASTERGVVRIHKVDPRQQRAALPPPPAANDDQDAGSGPLLTREQAVAFLAPWFPQGLTTKQLSAWCVEGKGPRGVRNGRYVLHYESWLRSWLGERLREISGHRAA